MYTVPVLRSLRVCEFTARFVCIAGCKLLWDKELRISKVLNGFVMIDCYVLNLNVSPYAAWGYGK